MLSDFFRINMPYGMEMNKNGEWTCFNREYLPLGCNDLNRAEDRKTFVFIKYKDINHVLFNKPFMDPSKVHWTSSMPKLLRRIWFYNDTNYPLISEHFWNQYIEKLKILSKLKVI